MVRCYTLVAPLGLSRRGWCDRIVRENLQLQRLPEPAAETGFSAKQETEAWVGISPVRLGMQIANVKQRQILPRVGNQIWVRTPQNRTYRTWNTAKFTPMVVRCYTPVAPLGLSRRGWCVAIHLSPLWG